MQQSSSSKDSSNSSGGATACWPVMSDNDDHSNHLKREMLKYKCNSHTKQQVATILVNSRNSNELSVNGSSALAPEAADATQVTHSDRIIN